MSLRRTWCALVLLFVVAVGGAGAFAREDLIEGESLVRGARAQAGAVSVQSMSGFGTAWSGSAQLFWAAPSTGAVLEVPVTVPAAGEYVLAAFFTRAPDYGVVAVGLRGARLATFDGYAERVSRSARVELGRVHLDAGPNPLTLSVLGQNRRSRGHYLGLDALAVEPVVARVPGVGPRLPGLKPPQVGPPGRRPAHVHSAITHHEPLIAAPKPRGAERRAVLETLGRLDRGLFARPGGASWRTVFPFHELEALASTPLPQMSAARVQRLEDLLTALDTMSLDPAYAPRMQDPALRDLHVKVRDLSNLAKEGPLAPAPMNDLAASAIFATLDDVQPVRWVLRVHVVVCADDDGGRASSVKASQIQACIALANQVFAPVPLRFLFDATKDWDSVQNTKMNTWDDAACAAYAKDPARRNKIVVVFGWGRDEKPATYAANAGTHIVAGPSAGDATATFCHELGHFLGLPHTFPGAGNQEVYGDVTKLTSANVDAIVAAYILSHGGTVDAMDGDGFSDTPPDPGNDYWEAKFGAKTSCDAKYPTATVTGPQGQTWTFTPDRTNLVSYFFGCPVVATLTAQQIQAILGRLEGTIPQPDEGLHRLIEGQIPGAASTGTIVLVGQIRNVGFAATAAGRTAVLADAQAGGVKVPLGPAFKVPAILPGDWIYVKVPLPGGLSWKGKACLTISPGDQNASNDELCPGPYKAPVVK